MPLKMFSGCLWLFNYRIGNLQTVCVAKPHTRHTVLNKTWLVLPADAPSVVVWAKKRQPEKAAILRVITGLTNRIGSLKTETAA